MATCPNCGATHTAARAVKRSTAPEYAERAEIDAAFLARTIDQPAYFKHCKRIGLRDDLRFLLPVAGYSLAGPLRVEAYDLSEQLEQRPATAADAKRINSIRDRYRMSKGSLLVRAGDGAHNAIEAA